MHDEFMKFVRKAMSVFDVKEDNGSQEKVDIERINYFEVMNVPKLTGMSQGSRDHTDIMTRSIKEEMSTFFTETSFTALTQIYRANSLWKRLLWTAVVVAMIVYMGIQCYWLVDRYYSYPVEVKMDLKASRVLDFPSVTICNLNPIKLENVKKEPYKPLETFADPSDFDLLFQATVDNWGQCRNDQFSCDNGKCLHESKHCDGNPDCKDHQDEKNCESYVCPVYLWKCASLPKCIFMDQRCDGKGGDCSPFSNEDEVNCHNNTCPEHYFRCSTGRCIPLQSVCDGTFHCQDNEINCSANNANKSYKKDDSPSAPPVAPSTTPSNTPPTAPSTTPSTSPLESWEDTPMSSSTAATSTNSRRKREAMFRSFLEELAGDSTYSQDEWDLYDEMVEYLRESKKPQKNSLKYLRAIWHALRDSLKKELLDHSYSQEREVFKRKQVKDGGNTNTEATFKVLRRSKRQGLASVNYPTSKTNVDVNMDAMVRNSTFTKWTILQQQAIQSRFYEERDDEYDAVMTYAYITANLSQPVVEMSGHQKQNFIASCDFAGYQCSPDNFTYFHNPKYGNCYIFNWLTPNTTKLETRFPGPEQGLRLELFLDQKNYVANLATEAGVRVLIHKKGSMPFPEDEGVSVMPGRSTSIGIKQVSYTRLPPPHGVCGDKGQTADYYSINYRTDYSKLSCLKSCYQDISIMFCNCAFPLYYVSGDMKVCNMTDKNIEHCVTGLPVKHSVSYDSCNRLCPLPCEETKYDLSLSMAQWPSDSYQPFLKSRLGKTNSLYCNIQASEREFTKLQIYFQDLIYQHVEQQKAYESMNLISDLGGQLGLWLGLSAITIGELCSCLFGMGRSLPMKCWRKKTSPSYVNDLTPTKPITPTTLHTMIEDMFPHAARYIPPDNATEKTSKSNSKI